MQSEPTGAFGSLRRRWRRYTGDRDLDLMIRAALRLKDYNGAAAEILDTRLMAIERPGWVQVYQFTVETKDLDGRERNLYGVARLDERRRSEVEIFESESTRQFKLTDWSQGLVRAHKRERSGLELLLLALFLLVVTAAFISWWSTQPN